MGQAADDKGGSRQMGGRFTSCGKESTTTEWCILWSDQLVQMMDGDVKTPAKKPRNTWKSGGASVIFILGRGSLDSIEDVDGKAGPYGPGLGDTKQKTSQATPRMGLARQILEKQNTASFPVPQQHLLKGKE